MDLGGFSDQLPTYPNNIQGELRLILQTKDVFLVCYKHLEEYRRLVNEQNRLITKEFVQEQLQIGEDEISELKMEYQDAEGRLTARLRHNELLADQLAGLGYASLESGGSIRHLALCRSTQGRKNIMAQRQSNINETRPGSHMIDNIALAIAEIHQEVKDKVKPLLDYYRDLFYLQLHFSLVLGQVCNYCMPLVTENISLIDRVFFWSERPEFDLIRRSGDISDRLKEIYTRAQTILGVLGESVRFLQSKVELQKTLEQRFHERLDEQQKTKDKILREVHGAKQSMDTLEEENDRLVGSLVKVDPAFVDSRHFVELAEGGNLSAYKKSPPTASNKDSGQHNAEIKVSNRTDTLINDLKPSTGSSSTTSLDVNNNKAASVADGAFKTAELQQNTSASNNDLKLLIEGLKDQIQDSNKSRRKTPSRRSTSRGDKQASNSKEDCSDSLDSVAPSIRQKKRSSSKPRSKHHRSDSNHEHKKRSNKKPTHSSNNKQRRSSSMDRKEAKRQKKVRSKSTIGVRQRDDSPREPQSINIRQQFRPMSSTDSSDPNVGIDAAAVPSPPSTLKTKLLGRTKDILDAALRRPSKASPSTLGTNESGPDDPNNEGVTSVSSFASLMVSDSPETGDDKQHQIQARHLRTLEPKSQSKKSSKKSSLLGHRKSKPTTPEYNDQFSKLPSLDSEKLLTDESADSQNDPVPRSRSRRPSTSRRKSSNSNLANFLGNTTTTSIEDRGPSSPTTSLPPLL